MHEDWLRQTKKYQKSCILCFGLQGPPTLVAKIVRPGFSIINNDLSILQIKKLMQVLWSGCQVLSLTNQTQTCFFAVSQRKTVCLLHTVGVHLLKLTLTFKNLCTCFFQKLKSRKLFQFLKVIFSVPSFFNVKSKQHF